MLLVARTAVCLAFLMSAIAAKPMHREHVSKSKTEAHEDAPDVVVINHMALTDFEKTENVVVESFEFTNGKKSWLATDFLQSVSGMKKQKPHVEFDITVEKLPKKNTSPVPHNKYGPIPFGAEAMSFTEGFIAIFVRELSEKHNPVPNFCDLGSIGENWDVHRKTTPVTIGVKQPHGSGHKQGPISHATIHPFVLADGDKFVAQKKQFISTGDSLWVAVSQVCFADPFFNFKHHSDDAIVRMSITPRNPYGYLSWDIAKDLPLDLLFVAIYAILTGMWLWKMYRSEWCLSIHKLIAWVLLLGFFMALVRLMVLEHLNAHPHNHTNGTHGVVAVWDIFEAIYSSALIVLIGFAATGSGVSCQLPTKKQLLAVGVVALCNLLYGLTTVALSQGESMEHQMFLATQPHHKRMPLADVRMTAGLIGNMSATMINALFIYFVFRAQKRTAAELEMKLEEHPELHGRHAMVTKLLNGLSLCTTLGVSMLVARTILSDIYWATRSPQLLWLWETCLASSLWSSQQLLLVAVFVWVYWPATTLEQFSKNYLYAAVPGGNIDTIGGSMRTTQKEGRSTTGGAFDWVQRINKYKWRKSMRKFNEQLMAEI